MEFNVHNFDWPSFLLGGITAFNVALAAANLWGQAFVERYVRLARERAEEEGAEMEKLKGVLHRGR